MPPNVYLRSLLPLLLIFSAATCARAQPNIEASSSQPAENMTLLGQWDDPLLFTPEGGGNRYSDVWGYAAPDGREYALLGSRAFGHVLDITDPTAIREVARLNINPDDRRSAWRDFKVFGDFAYMVTEQREGGLQVIDLRDLPDKATVLQRDLTAFQTAHNALIDATVTPARLYALGTDTRSDGIIVMSLADPAQPTLLASTPLAGGYVHDAYVRDNILYANHGNTGLYIYDVSDPTQPLLLGLLEQYAESGYNHSSWLTEDGNHLVFCDETFDTGVKVADVSDFTDLEVSSLFRSSNIAGADRGSMAHNPYVVGNDRVVLSYYDEGIQVWNISDKAAPRRLGYYDTTPGQTNYNASGVWGAYPYLPSGRILASDQLGGLFVLELNEAVLPVTYASWSVRPRKQTALLEWSVYRTRDNAGWTIERSADGRRFVPITEVAATGATDYSYLDEAAAGGGTVYYRLRQHDLDGTQHLSSVRSVTLGSVTNFTVYPNPATAGQQLHLGGAGAQVDYEVRTIDGRLLQTGRTTSAASLQLTNEVSAGVYLVRLPASGKQQRIVVR